eukprot:Blabericola_migrator_1__521@NODE_1128_length_5346_cov_67_075014_g307_i2_p2_GENE_NODE_1128_length_5346_cov_67_075014_g307_i2NODE_1128_length_5346_cov_67_075014_g307_i2_p2_ORF_typecomplete_len398_score71_67WD40/PF00400_32/6_1WD40/PF00400_32/1_9e12ANAPC4_WD40/PF12894_7/1_2ANAPC4_WD40/PF12894_7/5_5e09WD40_like/PF17005_5/40WD40_like/PF17005_5/3_3e05Ge1_WD40/PF16529_5/1_2e06Nup160/PF11715_8/3_5e05eIF2A/PF08662_11/0_0043CRT10/PF08728_10/0_006Nbas_N/PF15492_6/1_3e02Nbas_N/PF15492_6/0_28Cytochrom_D1/PF02
MCESIFLTCDYGSRLMAKAYGHFRTKTLLNAKIPGGPPSVFQLSKYAKGDLRLLMGNERYLTVLDVENLLASPPLPGGLLSRNGASSSSFKPLFHRVAERGVCGGPLLAGEFGESSNIIITASEIEGVVIRDLRIYGGGESIFPDVEHQELKFSLTKRLGLPPRSLRYTTFSPCFEDVIILTESSLYFVDRRFMQKPRLALKLPLTGNDSAHRMGAARGRSDDVHPAWISTRKGGILLSDYATLSTEEPITALTPGLSSADAATSSSASNLFAFRPEEDATISVLAVHPFNASMMVTGSSSGLLNIWDVNAILTGGNTKASRNQEISIEPVTLLGHDGWIWSIDFSRDGNLMVSGSSDATIRIWDLNEGTELTTISNVAEGQRHTLQQGILHVGILD